MVCLHDAHGGILRVLCCSPAPHTVLHHPRFQQQHGFGDTLQLTHTRQVAARHAADDHEVVAAIVYVAGIGVHLRDVIHAAESFQHRCICRTAGDGDVSQFHSEVFPDGDGDGHRHSRHTFILLGGNGYLMLAKLCRRTADGDGLRRVVLLHRHSVGQSLDGDTLSTAAPRYDDVLHRLPFLDALRLVAGGTADDSRIGQLTRLETSQVGGTATVRIGIRQDDTLVNHVTALDEPEQRSLGKASVGLPVKEYQSLIVCRLEVSLCTSDAANVP